MVNTELKSPWWVTGITDSEGNFSINYAKTTDKVTFSYKVSQKAHSLDMLVKLKNYFNIGNINWDNKKNDAYKFIVGNTDDLISTIIPHFDEYPLVGSKQLDFLDWKEAILTYVNNKNIQNVLIIKQRMNSKRSFDQRWNYLAQKDIVLKPEWIQAFVDGEGCFFCGIGYHKNRDKKILKITNTLEIAQNTHDVEVLMAIKNYFEQGYIKPKFDTSCLKESKQVRSISRYITYSSDIIIAFFDKYPMYTRKHLDYIDWKKLIDLKSKNMHNEEQGLVDMLNIKRGMNVNRLYNSSLLGKQDKLNMISLLDTPGSTKHYHTKCDKPQYFSEFKIKTNPSRFFSCNRYKGSWLERFKYNISYWRNIDWRSIDWGIIRDWFMIIFLILAYIGPALLVLEDVLHNFKLKRELDGIDDYFCGYSDTYLIPNGCIDILPTEIDILPTETNSNTIDANILHTELYSPENYYDPFEIQDPNVLDTQGIINQNNLAFISNSNLDYQVFDIGSTRFIVTDNAIFGPEFIEIMKDVCIEIQQVNDRCGNSIINLRIDPEVANELGIINQLDSGYSLYSGIYEARQASDSNYERDIRAIRTEAVQSLSPEIRQIISSMGRGGLTVIDFTEVQSPSVISSDLNREINNNLTYEDARALMVHNEMGELRQRRLQLLFERMDVVDHPEAWPLWSEVPVRPSDPQAIELWERDNVMRRYWSSRLNGGYTQTNIVISDRPLVEEDSDVDRFTEEFSRLSILADMDADDMFTEEFSRLSILADVYTDDMFTEEFSRLSTLADDPDIFEGESLYLDRLFDQE